MTCDRHHYDDAGRQCVPYPTLISFLCKQVLQGFDGTAHSLCRMFQIVSEIMQPLLGHL